MATSRVRRGRKTQELVAEWFRERGWPNAASRPASLPGEDVMGLPFSLEVKASSRFNVLSALRQAQANSAGKLPAVVHRPDGYGPERIGNWVVSLDLSAFTALLVRAGLCEDQAVYEQHLLKAVPDDAA